MITRYTEVDIATVIRQSSSTGQSDVWWTDPEAAAAGCCPCLEEPVACQVSLCRARKSSAVSAILPALSEH